MNLLLGFARSKSPMSVSRPSIVSRTSASPIRAAQPMAAKTKEEAHHNLVTCCRLLRDDEQMFVAQLDVLVDDILRPLIAQHAGWPAHTEDAERVKQAVAAVANVVNEFVQDLKGVVANEADPSLARSLEKFLHKFEVYAEFRTVWHDVHRSFAPETMNETARKIQEVPGCACVRVCEFSRERRQAARFQYKRDDYTFHELIARPLTRMIAYVGAVRDVLMAIGEQMPVEKVALRHLVRDLSELASRCAAPVDDDHDDRDADEHHNGGTATESVTSDGMRRLSGGGDSDDDETSPRSGELRAVRHGSSQVRHDVVIGAYAQCNRVPLQGLGKRNDFDSDVRCCVLLLSAVVQLVENRLKIREGHHLQPMLKRKCCLDHRDVVSALTRCAHVVLLYNDSRHTTGRARRHWRARSSRASGARDADRLAPCPTRARPLAAVAAAVVLAQPARDLPTCSRRLLRCDRSKWSTAYCRRRCRRWAPLRARRRHCWRCAFDRFCESTTSA
jgi:hypothetical protein